MRTEDEFLERVHTACEGATLTQARKGRGLRCDPDRSRGRVPFHLAVQALARQAQGNVQAAVQRDAFRFWNPGPLASQVTTAVFDPSSHFTVAFRASAKPRSGTKVLPPRIMAEGRASFPWHPRTRARELLAPCSGDGGGVRYRSTVE